MTNDEGQEERDQPFSSFEHSLLFRHSTFVLRHYSYFPARTSSTGTCALCRTSLIVLPKRRSPNNRWPCAVIAIKSHCRSSAAFKIPSAGSPKARNTSTF